MSAALVALCLPGHAVDVQQLDSGSFAGWWLARCCCGTAAVGRRLSMALQLEHQLTRLEQLLAEVRAGAA